MPAILLKLLPFVQKYWLLIALGTMIAGLLGANKWQSGKIDRLNLEKAETKVELLQAREVNRLNKLSVKELQRLLEECAAIRKQEEDKARQAVAKLREERRNALEQTREDVDKAKKALSGEACADVAIPSDVERVLRKAAARANGDS